MSSDAVSTWFRGGFTARQAVAAVVLGSAALLGCAAQPPSLEPGRETCVELAAEAVGLAWSQNGRFVAIGTVGPDGSTGARVATAEGVFVGHMIGEPGMLPETVVVSPEGRLAWLAETPTGRAIVDDREAGRIDTAVPDGVVGLGWTAIGYALLQRTDGGGHRVLILDPDRPAEPTVTYETDLLVERMWISADPESMLLTIAHPDHRDAPVSFEVVGATASRRIEPPGADTSGASMPSLRRQVAYRSATSGRMVAVRVDDPGSPATLSDIPALRGMISDRGVLALAASEPRGRLCLIDVAARLP